MTSVAHETTPRPVALTVIPENIPGKLISLDHWVGWRYELGEKNKWTKPPFKINAPKEHASSTNPATWTSFGKALQAYQRGDFDGIGFVITPADRFVGGDNDHCIDPTTRTIDGSACETISRVATYWEVSASGQGVHFFGHATFPGTGRKVGPHELYKDGRYFTVTGHHITGTPTDIRDVQPEIDALYQEWFPSSTNAQPSLENTLPLDAPGAESTSNGHHAQQDPPKKTVLSDTEIIVRATTEAAPKFPLLITGEWTKVKGKKNADGVYDPDLATYPSQSEADEALCEILSYFSDDPKQLDRIFRSSGLMRPKWLAKRGESTWGAITIQTALNHAKNQTTAYAPPSNPDNLTGSWKDKREENEGAPVPASADRPWPEPPGNAAFAGLAGRFVETLLPYTEADPTALLVSFLTAFPIAVGRGPHCMVGAVRHDPRLFTALVGKTSKSRKGDSVTTALLPFAAADPDWYARRITGGLSSGEGLIWSIRDPIETSSPIKEKGRITGYESLISDPGVKDKRLLVRESEFARVLGTMSRQGNTLSPVIRQAWDPDDLQIMTKTSAARSTAPHIGILACITAEELTRELSDSESVNGFANRFLFVVIKRSKELPEPEPFVGAVADALAQEIQTALIRSRPVGQMKRSPSAKELWAQVYHDLSEERTGLLGSLSARAEAQCLRLSAIYALLDRSLVIEPEHIRSALEVWGYVDRSLDYLFGNATGDPVADTIIAALRMNREMSRNQICDHFGRHETSGRIGHALRLLLTTGRAVSESRTTGGRPAEVWRLA